MAGGKVALLVQNDDFGRDYAHGFKKGVGEVANSMIVAETTYEVTDPKIDSQAIELKASGAAALFSVTLGKFSSRAIRKVAETRWRPKEFFVPTSSSPLKFILEPAGLENAVGLRTMRAGRSIAPSSPPICPSSIPTTPAR